MWEENSELRQVRNRIADLRKLGHDPMEVVLSPDTWSRLQVQHKEGTPGLIGRLAVRDVLGVRGRLVEGVAGCSIRYFGGIDFPPDPAVTDGFVDLAHLRDITPSGAVSHD